MLLAAAVGAAVWEGVGNEGGAAREPALDTARNSVESG